MPHYSRTLYEVHLKQTNSEGKPGFKHIGLVQEQTSPAAPVHCSYITRSVTIQFSSLITFTLNLKIQRLIRIKNHSAIFSYRQPITGIVLLLLCVAFTVATDRLFTAFQKTPFYLSESLLFSSYWLLFLPLLSMLKRLSSRRKKLERKIVGHLLAIVAHLLGYPALVWLLSFVFYPHTFAYSQTLAYGLTTFLLTTVIVYGLMLPLMAMYQRKSLQHFAPTLKTEETPPTFLTSLLVPDTHNCKTVIVVTEILYFSANPPYVTIHHPQKNFLFTSTLKSLEAQLDNSQFVRIHKSHIVNIGLVHSYKSRLNGDYDLTLIDDTILRVSRNYAGAFKSAFENRPPVAAK